MAANIRSPGPRQRGATPPPVGRSNLLADPPDDHPPRLLPSRRWKIVGAVALASDLVIAGAFLGLAASGAFNRDRDALAFLGRAVDASTCRTSPLEWSVEAWVSCRTWSATVTPSSTATTITLYAGGHDGYGEYTGPMPLSLRWHETITDVATELGSPWRISNSYATPVLVYVVRGQAYGALELKFDEGASLVEVSATLAN
jgi:hypothetical protein